MASMVHSRFAILAVIAALVSVALSTGSKAAATLAGSEWRPIEVEGAAIEGAPEVFLQFRGEGKVTGHGGCNRFFGSFTLDGDRIEFGPFGATRKACPQPVMDREREFLDTLEKTTTFVRDRIRLSLFDSACNVAMKLIQTDPD